MHVHDGMVLVTASRTTIIGEDTVGDSHNMLKSTGL